MEIPAIHGLPVLLRVGEKDRATVCFASCRKHPKLKQKINAIVKLEKAENEALRDMLALMTEVEEAAGELSAGLQGKASKATEAYSSASERRLVAVGDFIVEGLKGAGYTDSDVEYYLPYFDPDRYQDLIQRCLVGCGRLDFFTERSQPDES